MQTATASQTRHWDIFCKVIDNFGDIGVCWRLACNLAQRGQQVRLWVDDASALAWMAPQGCPGVQVRTWDTAHPQIGVDQPADVVIESFGCEIDHAWIASRQAAVQRSVWINLEYLSAEPYALRSHGLPSPVMHGSAAGWTKWFFYPGFTPGTGGLLRELDWPLQDDSRQPEPEFSQSISLFCYEPSALPQFLTQLAQGPVATQLLVTAGRASAAVDQCAAHLWPDITAKTVQWALKDRFNYKNPLKSKYSLVKQLSISEHLQCDFLPALSQPDYDQLLRYSQLNFVRGEDSLVRALWAGQAFIWHIYPQADGAHAAKLDAFLDWLNAPSDLRLFHHVWNGLSNQALPAINRPAWQAVALRARRVLLAQPSLTEQLMQFSSKTANGAAAGHVEY
jgi:uncharacterized repeat protein (TIGR03837 family)